MEKSHTLKKFEIDQVVVLAISKIQKWTEREIRSMSFKNGKPQCLLLGDDFYRVGNHSIKKIHDTCWRLTDDDKNNDFMFRRAAIGYSLAKQSHVFFLADGFKEADQQYSNHYNDYMLFKSRLENALKRGDEWDILRYAARKKQAQIHYFTASARLAKCMRLLKYYKLLQNGGVENK
jgi:hypothetical protein